MDDFDVGIEQLNKQQIEQLWRLFKLISIICVVATAVITSIHFYQFYRNWTMPRIESLFLRILILPVAWSVLSLVNVFEPQLRFLIFIFIDLVEAFCILSFMQLVYAYLGGKEQARWKAENKPSLRACLCIKVTPGESLMKLLHWFIYQFVFIRPALAAVICALYYKDLYEKSLLGGNPLPTIFTVVLFTSLIFCLLGLLLVYRIFRLVLAPVNIGYKFSAIKLFIFLHVVQSFLFTAIETFAKKKAQEQGKPVEAIQALAATIVRAENCLLCVEMVIAALLNMFVFFSYKEFIPEDETLMLHNKKSSKTTNYSADRIGLSESSKLANSGTSDSTPLVISDDSV